ncbi:hypothetical protein ABIA35_000313 [Catenulispora sp. MAP12-49]|uniref:IPT/TIG domain-containing protein n=1 Tax=unclassified Catenulispora TaxID=414885 RepID=UPI003514049B
MPISPNRGTTAGGTAVTITGTDLTGATAVRFGVAAATGVTNVSPTEITAVSPAGTGAVEVTVTTPGGESNPAPFFYVGAPTVTAVSPVSGPFGGGNTVTITGINLATASAVMFAANPGTITGVTDSTLIATVPRGSSAGSVSIVVVTGGGSADGISYDYLANPTMTAVVPVSGPASGGNIVTITGTDLTSTEQVVFGPNAVHAGGQNAAFTVISDTEIAAIAPAEAVGPADVIVASPGGSFSLQGGYTYESGPSI